MSRLLVVGAGISGLAAAILLDKEGHDVTVWERADAPGGNVRTDRVDGRVVDRAANGWLDNEPEMQKLLEHLGLVPRLIPANDRFGTRWILADGRMQPAPLGPGKLLRSDLISAGAKARVALEPFMPRGASARAEDFAADESVGDFVRRRLGPAFVDRMVGPMVAGIYAADPDDLSLRGALNRMFELEREHRSLILAMMRLRRGGAPAGHLHTLPGGAGELTEVMAAQLGDRVSCGRTVKAVERVTDGWQVTATDDDNAVQQATFDRVVLACPAPAQAHIVRELDAAAAQALDGIPYAPVAVVCSAWSPGSWSQDPHGFGVLLARGEAEKLGAHGVLGMLFTSSIFPNQAKGDEVLLRTVMGGAIAPEVVSLSDQALLARSRRVAAVCLGPERQGPQYVQVYRHPAGIPRYRVGHPVRVAQVRSAEQRHPGLHFVGNHLDGVGVKDCARAAARLVERISQAG